MRNAQWWSHFFFISFITPRRTWNSRAIAHPLVSGALNAKRPWAIGRDFTVLPQEQNSTEAIQKMQALLFVLIEVQATKKPKRKSFLPGQFDHTSTYLTSGWHSKVPTKRAKSPTLYKATLFSPNSALYQHCKRPLPSELTISYPVMMPGRRKKRDKTLSPCEAQPFPI